MAVRRPAEWMRASDDRILEFLEAEGVARVKAIDESDEVNYDYETIRRRAKKLSKAGLLKDIGNGVYQITDRGQGYLSGGENLRKEPDPDSPDDEETES